MPGIFGTRAPLLADLTLIVVAFNAALLLFSYQTIRRGDVLRHRRLMIAAFAISLLAIALLMIPSSFLLPPPSPAQVGGEVVPVPLPHMVGGGLTMLLALYLIISMYNYPRPNRLRVRFFKNLMRLLLILWLALTVSGFIVYASKYVL